MPYYKLMSYVGYKALWEGIKVIRVKECYTSITCHGCGANGKRVSQGLFLCSSCGLEYNADLNGAINIAKLSLGYMLRDGAGLTQPLTEREAVPPACSHEAGMAESSESPYFRGRSVKSLASSYTCEGFKKRV